MDKNVEVMAFDPLMIKDMGLQAIVWEGGRLKYACFKKDTPIYIKRKKELQRDQCPQTT